MRSERIAARRAALVTSIVLTLVGCGGTVRPETTPLPRQERSSRTFITATDFASLSSGLSAFDAIQRLRPMYLRPSPSMGAPVTRAPVVAVYINGAFAGGPEALDMMSADVVESARFLERSEALRYVRLMQPGDAFIMITLKHFARSP